MNFNLVGIEEYRKQKAQDKDPAISFQSRGAGYLEVALTGTLPNGTVWRETEWISKELWFVDYRMRRAAAKLIKRYKKLCAIISEPIK